MNVKPLALAVVALGLVGCDGAVFVGRPHPRREVVVYREPGPVYRPGPAAVVVTPAPGPVYAPAPGVVYAPAPGPVYAAAPVTYEEGAVVNGVVVVEPQGVTDYVFMNGGYYYWHPGLGIWVHARRDAGWRPGGGIHVYGSFAEHPAYRGRGR
jgi:hypothetical protein